MSLQKNTWMGSVTHEPDTKTDHQRQSQNGANNSKAKTQVANLVHVRVEGLSKSSHAWPSWTFLIQPGCLAIPHSPTLVASNQAGIEPGMCPTGDASDQKYIQQGIGPTGDASKKNNVLPTRR